MENEKKKSKTDEEVAPRVVRCPADLQRLRLEKLMKNPEKPVVIPDRPKEKALPGAPDFVRNVMGSSAGAGSGEFHVYRHLRRKELARQKFIQEKSKKELLDDDYHNKLELNKKMAEERTAKKRAKRLKKKEKLKNKAKKPKVEKHSEESEKTSGSDSDERNGTTIEDDIPDENEGKNKVGSEVEHSNNINQKNEVSETKTKKDGISNNEGKNCDF